MLKYINSMKKPIIKINRFDGYYEALFLGGNLYAFTIKDLVNQLVNIYGFERKIFGLFEVEHLN